MTVSRWHLPDEDATARWAGQLAGVLRAPLVIALEGDLGAGKTTLARALMRSLGFDGPVPSPTYTLVETYDVAGLRLHHLDLYRLADPEELEFIGLRDLLAEEAVVLVEWPRCGEGVLPAADISVTLTATAQTGRDLTIEAGSERGSELVDALAAMLPVDT